MDAEQLLNILEELDSDDEEMEPIRDSSQIDLILMPPLDGADSDRDDADSDDEPLGTIRDIGKGVLKQPMEIICHKNGEQNIVHLDASNVEAANIDEQTVQEFSSDDEIPLAKNLKKNYM